MFLVSAIAFWTLVGGFVFHWNGLPARGRKLARRLPLGLAGLCFGAAPFATGARSSDVIAFIGGPIPYVTETVERSNTMLLAGLGIAFAGAYGLIRLSPRLPVRGPVGKALWLSVVVIALRVYLEKLGVAAGAALLVGIIFLIPAVGIYFGTEAARLGAPKAFWKWLPAYTFALRAIVIVVMVVATYFELGTHFDNSTMVHTPAAGQARTVGARTPLGYLNFILLPQLLLWPTVTIAGGALVGMPAYIWARRRLRTGADGRPAHH